MATHIHPHLHRSASLKRKAAHKRHSRIRWELVIFASLTVLFTVARLYFKYELPDKYLSVAEHSCLFTEIVSFIGGEG